MGRIVRAQRLLSSHRGSTLLRGVSFPTCRFAMPEIVGARGARHLREQVPLLHKMNDPIGEIACAAIECIESQIWVARPLVRRIQAGEVAQLAAPRLSVKSFWIPLLADFERRIDENLNEFIWCHQATRHFPFGAEWRNKGHNCY